MVDKERLAPTLARPSAVQSCWMCGIRLPVSQMVADGGSACTDVRWYCLDMRSCTARWTRRGRVGGAHHGAAGAPEARALTTPAPPGTPAGAPA